MERSKALRVVKRLTENGMAAHWFGSYSGRGMFGELTDGVVIEEVWLIPQAEKVCRSLKKCSRESLGKGAIFY